MALIEVAIDSLAMKEAPAPAGGLATGVLRCHAAGGECRRLVAGEDIALRLGKVRIVVTQIERECLPGKKVRPTSQVK